MIGATVIPASFVLLLVSAANRQSCEAIVQDGDGRSDFESLQSAIRARPYSIVLYAFDLLHLDGKDLRQQTLLERRGELKRLVGSDAESRIQFSDEFDGDGDALFKACADRELEASSPNIHSLPIGLVEAGLGSRPNASPNPFFW